ncbi:MAG: hypothetical protein HS123_15670 [Solibacteraceae bacterium]|nr:hypothetical protein [Solibacteraceae bacterium]
MTIGWIETPAFGPALFARRQTFEITLETGGAIEMAFYDVNIAAHVTGMGPGGLGGRTRVVTLAGAGGERFDATVAEPYSQVPQLDTARLAQRFYETHDDGFDYLVVFNTAGLAAAPNAVATQTTVRSFTHGIGDFLIENGQIYGSGRRLQAFLNMGQLRHYPLYPNAPVGPRGRLTGDTTLSLLAHEAGHLFLALASVRAPGNPEARPMLSPDLAHWSFNFNSDASVLEGNRIEDAGEGAAVGRFLTAGAVDRYSVWDRYLMGLIAPDEVQPSFVVWPSTIPASRLPQTGLRFNGQRLDVRIEDLIEAEGPRAPSHELAQRRFQFAFILVSEPGRRRRRLKSQVDRTGARLCPISTRSAAGRLGPTPACAAHWAFRRGRWRDCWRAARRWCGSAAPGWKRSRWPWGSARRTGIWKRRDVRIAARLRRRVSSSRRGRLVMRT